MPRSIKSCWQVGWLFVAVAFAGCATETSPSGDLAIELELVDGVEIDEVSYSVTGNGIAPMTGAIDTSAPGTTASVELYGIPAGDKYKVAMSATSTDRETTCSGSANFNVAVGQVTGVKVILKCKLGDELGGVRVNGEINFCTDLVWVDVSPLQASIGNQIDVFARAADIEGDPFDYKWTGTGGTFADPSAQRTTFTCLEVGDQTITITVSDDGFDYCTCNRTVDVRCVDGDGTGGQGGHGGQAGTGGEGGSGGQAGTGGQGGMGGTGGTAGAGGMGGMAGAGGMGGAGGTGGMGGGGACIPDGGAQHAGPANRACPGTDGCGELEVCVEGACEEAALVFVSSRQSDAALGGPRGADKICANLARAAGLGGYWMSWTSDACTSPQRRFEESTISYRLLNGTLTADGWADLTDGQLENPIDMDEMRNVVVGTDKFARDTLVWTSTESNGAAHSNIGCWGLRSNDIGGVFGVPASAGSTTSIGPAWTVWSTPQCSTDNVRIYCFEQP